MRHRIVALLIPLALCSCGLLQEQTVKLITDRPEMAAYVERFNARQTDVRVEIIYDEAPSQVALAGRVAGDVVIAQWLASPSIMARFDSLADIVKPSRIDPAWFYPGLLAMGSRDNRPILLPLSFSLPAIVSYRPAVAADLPNLALPLDTMRAMGKAFNATGKNGPAAIGFSPLWNSQFLFDASLLLGVRFRAGRNGQAVWDADALSRTVELARSWIAEVNGGAAADKVFADRTLVQPSAKLLSAKKILFALMPFADYFSLPEEKRRNLDFRWLSDGRNIPVRDDVLLAGVLRSARNKGGARAFLEWFFSPQTQRSLLEVNQSRRIGVFCIANGFSSFKSINEKDLPQKYPLLLGRIPPESLLLFPDTLPDDWAAVRDEVIGPWLSRSAAGEERQTLEKVLDEWRTARIE
jgi:ABC-type glycerol-3-phosphate transport system substrate-binding protein